MVFEIITIPSQAHRNTCEIKMMSDELIQSHFSNSGLKRQKIKIKK